MARQEGTTTDDNEKQTEEGAVAEALMERVKGVLAEYHLSGMGQSLVLAWLKESLGREGEEMERVKHWIVMKLNGLRRQVERTRTTAPAWQVGCAEILPLLRAQPVWSDEASMMGWVRRVEAAATVVKEELLGLRGKKGFQQYRAPSWASSKTAEVSSDGRGTISHDAGDWNVFYLYLHNLDFADNRALCPVTCELIESLVPRHYHHAFFSALAPGTHITKHHGPTNKKLRCQLPLIVPDGGSCQLRVADQTITLEEGKLIVFDDSFEHEAWNRHASQSRLVLVFDLWHPDLSDREIKFFSLLLKASMRAEKRLGEQARRCSGGGDDDDDDGREAGQQQKPGEKEEGEDFYELIEKGREVGADESHVWEGVTGD